MANTFVNPANAAAYAAGVKARAALRSLTSAVDAALEGKGNKATYTSQIAAAQTAADSAVDAFETAIGATT